MTKLTGLSFSSDVLPLIFSLVAIVFVLYLCYLFSKFVAKKVNHVSDSNNIKVLERVAIAQDKGLAVIEICGKYYLIGFANNNIEILKELDKDELKFPQSAIKGNFLEILNSTMKNRWDVKPFGRNNASLGEADDAQGSNEEEKKENK